MKRIVWLALVSLLPFCLQAQELNAKVTINHAQIQGTDASVFETLKQSLEQLLNDRQWTDYQFQKHERITCNFNITVTKYDKTTNRFECSAMIQANRPVYYSTYTTTLYNNKDDDFHFDYQQYDQLNFQEDIIDNQLTALFAYYAYLNLGFPGWKAFETSRNRFAIINDYLDEPMRPMRQLQYDYYRTGLDEMSTNAERGRTHITTALQNLKQAHENKPLSLLPQIWTDYKRDELANIYKGKGTQKEKQEVYDLLFNINASQSNAWDEIKK